MMNPAAWLAQVAETPIDPELPILDAHHHFWDLGGQYFLEELVEDTSELNVRRTVFVECDSMYRTDPPEHLRCVGETEFVEELAKQSASGRYGEMRAAAGIVGTADLTLGSAVGAVLEAHLEASPVRFRGIRHRAAWAEERPPGSIERPELLADPRFREGFARLAEYGLTFDAWVYHTQLSELANLAAAFPDTTIVLNHLGHPLGNQMEPERVFAQWRVGLAAVAALENVVLKIGGVQLPGDGPEWHARDLPPTSEELLHANRAWYLAAVELFGPERCMFVSNFPVERVSCSYVVLWNQFKKLTHSFSPEERAAMFHDTAARVYRLPTLGSDSTAASSPAL